MWQNLEFIASRIQKKLDGGVVTDDSRIDLDIIKDEVHKARAELIGLMAQKSLRLPHVYFQKISCLKVVCEELVCDGIPSGVFQNYVNLPSSLIGAWGKKSLLAVGNIDGLIKFDWSRSNYSMPYGGKKQGTYDIENNSKLIFTNLSCPLAFVFIEGLFTDPLAAINASGCPNWDSPYPVVGDDLGRIEDIVFKRMSPQKQIRHDTKNDAQAT
jgi:hypothetical protein